VKVNLIHHPERRQASQYLDVPGPDHQRLPGVPMQTSYDLLRTLPFLSGFTDWQLECLSRLGQRTILHAGQRIFYEGDPADRLWLIIDGRVNVDTRLPHRGDVVVETLGAGSILGWSWLFPPYRWHFGAVAVETVRAVALDGPALREMCQRDPMIGYQLTLGLTQVVVERLQATRRRLIEVYDA
jgi:CRP/FNR family transcriptional regulator, cyclic AMP receptor protein